VRGKVEGPFGNNVMFYTQRYWPVIPVHANSKECAIVGYTGRDGAYPTRDELKAWESDYAGHNIAIRLPKDIIGIDVDAYGTKDGYATLKALEEDLGELPHTYVITSRTDGASGIRLFRCDPKANWKGAAGIGIDVLTWYHRYAVVSPSVHPDTKVEYEWYHEAGEEYEFQPATCPSYKDDIIPALPESWVSHLRSGFAGNKSARMTQARHRAWLEENVAGEPCDAMTATTSLWIDRITDAGDGGGAHDAMLSGVKAVIGDSMAGHSGMSAELVRLRNTFYEGISARRSRNDAESEWRRAVMGAVNLNRGSERADSDPCSDGSLDPKSFGPTRKNGQKVTPETFKQGHRQTDDSRFAKDVATALRGMRINQEARRSLQAEHAAEMPEIMPLDDWLGREVPPPMPLIPGLIALEGNTLLVAQPKAGKSTVVHNLIRAVADEDYFLESEDLEAAPFPKGKRIALLDFEIHEGLLTEWLNHQGIINQDRVAISSLEGCASSFNILDPFCLRDWVDKMKAANVGYLILDCLAPALAAVGVEENSNTEVGAWLNAMVTLVKECGAYGMMIVHHTGKVGESARGASRLEGWTSDNLRLTLQGQGEGDDGQFVRADRFLSARGRIASDFNECQLGFSRETKRLMVIGGSKREVAAERAQPEVVAYIQTNPGCSKASIDNNVSGKSDAKRTAVKQLMEEGEVCDHGKHNSAALFYHNCPDPAFHTAKLKV